MKTKRMRVISPLAMALILSTGTVANVKGGQGSGTKVASVVELHAANGAASSVTIWTPKPAQTREQSTVAKTRAPKVIDLKASNGSVASVTVWTPGQVQAPGTEPKVDVAPLK